jgi:hypothetical protein
MDVMSHVYSSLQMERIPTVMIRLTSVPKTRCLRRFLSPRLMRDVRISGLLLWQMPKIVSNVMSLLLMIARYVVHSIASACEVDALRQYFQHADSHCDSTPYSFIQEINQTTFDTVSSCGDSMVSISAMDQCMNPSDAELPVKIDDTPPTVSCSFAGEKDATVKRALTSKQMFDRGFEYDASDNCGGPLNVTVDVFSNEREGMWYRCDMAIFYNDKILHQTNNNGKLYLQENICPEPTNGQCLKDPNVKEARLYTIVVTAVDEAGLSSSGECTMTIEPVDKTPPTSTSTQRIHLNSYYSIFNTP